MDTPSSRMLLDNLVSQLNGLKQRRLAGSGSHQNHRTKLGAPATNLSQNQLDYIVKNTSLKILSQISQNMETRRHSKVSICQRQQDCPEPSFADLSFCNAQPSLKFAQQPPKPERKSRVDLTTNLYQIRNKADQLVSRIKNMS